MRHKTTINDTDRRNFVMNSKKFPTFETRAALNKYVKENRAKIDKEIKLII